MTGLITSVWSQLAALATGTFVSEDLTSVSAGILSREGRITPAVAIGGCFLGVFIGDLGLWGLGRFIGQPIWNSRWVKRRSSPGQMDRIAEFLDKLGGPTIALARFLPGTRLPLYVAAGVGGMSLGKFALWSGVAALVWTPVIVVAAMALGAAITAPLAALGWASWLAIPLVAVAIWASSRGLPRLLEARFRARWIARVSRLWRWEFWPSWLFYLPLVPYLIWLAIRYRSFTVWTAANPGIPQGGVVGESKSAIMAKLPACRVVPTALIPPGSSPRRVERFQALLAEQGWQFPLVLKPDAGQRGAGVKLVRSLEDATAYLSATVGPVIVQTYHPGPFEAGVFYYRLPGETTGHIFSVTDKEFPVVYGDGTSTLEELIWRHPRFRMQAARFLERHDRQRARVLAKGEKLPLAIAGNHCQGTLFRDGSALLTPELEQTIDSIARHFDGFFIGRFDIRYEDKSAFRAGRDLAIVELNGVTSESTNIYDPSRSIWFAYRTLCRQWNLLFRIGNTNRARGIQPSRVRELWRLLSDYYAGPRPNPLAD